jgi:RHS repeat-associated protein
VNDLNQVKTMSAPGSVSLTYSYDDCGNRTGRSGATSKTATVADVCTYDFENRLVSLNRTAGGSTVTYGYTYDYRTRRVGRTEAGQTTNVVFSGGTSCYEKAGGTVSAEFIRGSDWGGGVGGILYTVRSGTIGYVHYDGRGDLTAETSSTGTLAFQTEYQAFGTHTDLQGSISDRQRASTKEEDPTGLLNEGMRYRDLELGSFITRDPAGFIDGPNLYAYVNQNPWSKFDPEGLNETLGFSNWFVDWVVPEPVAHWNAADRGADDMVNSNLDGVDRWAGGLSWFGNGAMVVLSLIPGEAALETGIEKAGVKAVAKATAREGTEVAAQKVERKVVQKAEQELEQSAAKTENKAAQEVSNSGGCFPAGTLVTTPAGSRPIETLVEGDTISAWDFEAGAQVPRKILQVLLHETDFWVSIDTTAETFTATRGHRFWVESHQQWVPAVELQPGMLLRLEDGSLAEIHSTRLIALERSEPTFNLEVDRDHNFFVGSAGALVHNGDVDSKTRITYTAPEYDAAGNRVGTYSGKATGPGNMSPQEVLDKRFSGSNHHPGHNLGTPTVDDVHDSKATMRGREQMLHEENAAQGQSTNKNNPVGKDNKAIEEYRTETEKKYGKTFQNGKKC